MIPTGRTTSAIVLRDVLTGTAVKNALGAMVRWVVALANRQLHRH
jgi:hypothetical protein